MLLNCTRPWVCRRNTTDPGYVVRALIMIINCLIGTDITDLDLRCAVKILCDITVVI